MVPLNTQPAHSTFESVYGVYLTAYVKNNGELDNLKAHIQNTLDQALQYLTPVMAPEHIQNFLAPIKNLLVDSSELKQLKGNLGIFRTYRTFRLVSLPIDISPLCVVANSFHIKPLLSWLQQNRENSSHHLERQLQDFRYAQALNRTDKSIVTIAKAAVQGRVKKLLIAADSQFFGKLNRKSGHVSFHPSQLDHQDDDILDDLAQMVLAKGGEVTIAPRKDIPQGRPILALLDNSQSLVRTLISAPRGSKTKSKHALNSAANESGMGTPNKHSLRSIFYKSFK